ncbi:hypothetical protein NDU88_002192 [Pleurodeles waltl]|uniref:Uncharacterized protein n=1 Tax=Pleurodeles waltl TaxID=8319 RepID=A0AAV7KS69_PLEWA|nr:hypothetical protein NDU88_002192 [Pleurodeles waltl]
MATATCNHFQTQRSAAVAHSTRWSASGKLGTSRLLPRTPAEAARLGAACGGARGSSADAVIATTTAASTTGYEEQATPHSNPAPIAAGTQEDWFSAICTQHSGKKYSLPPLGLRIALDTAP